MLKRLEKIEDELNIVRYQFELTQEYIKSQEQKTITLNSVIKTGSEEFKDINERLDFLEKELVFGCKQRTSMLKMITSTSKSLTTTMNMLADVIKNK